MRATVKDLLGIHLQMQNATVIKLKLCVQNPKLFSISVVITCRYCYVRLHRSNVTHCKKSAILDFKVLQNYKSGLEK